MLAEAAAAAPALATPAVAASCAGEELEAIAAEPFDLILCDYNLGDNTNGQQFLEYIRTRELISRNTLFIMITAEQTYQNVMLVAECTPDGSLLKPFTPAQLNARVNRLIARQEELEYVNRAVDLRRWDKAISECDKLVALRHNNTTKR